MAVDDPNDPEDRETRIRKLKLQAEELAGGSMVSIESEDYSPEIEEQFWEHVVAFEQAECVPLFDVLVKADISLPPPDELDDSRLAAKLWEVVDGLFLLGAYLEHTDHLSDRELYVYLWSDVLREPATLLPDNPDFSYHIDLTGSGSEEDNLIYLKYYADEDARRQWAKDWPRDVLPDHERLPYDRDRHLPQAGSKGQFPVM